MRSWHPGRSEAPRRTEAAALSEPAALSEAPRISEAAGVSETPPISEAPDRRVWPGSRRLALAVGAGVALLGTVVGVAMAEVTAAPQVTARAAGAHQAGSARTAEPATRNAGSAGAAGSASRHAQTRARAHHRVRAARVTALRTSCRSVAHVGDSTSVDLISPAFLPNQAQRLQARYADVGVRHLLVDASSGRSIVEALPGQVNGYNVAAAWRAAGFRGCWVIALGTNDSANIATGSAVGATARINEMMSVAHGQPVLWVNAATLLSSGPWANANEQSWDNALLKAARRYPNLRILNWSAIAKPGWFLPDGIHYNSLGCAMRAQAIADGLARAFPLNGHSKGQIVR